jgi:hypothetical protein
MKINRLSGILAGGTASAQSKTAQSAMVATVYDSTAYIIEPTITYSYDSACAGAYFSTVITGPVVTCDTSRWEPAA